MGLKPSPPRPLLPQTRYILDGSQIIASQWSLRRISISHGLFSGHLDRPARRRAGGGIATSLLLTDILIFQLMTESNSLRLVLDRFAVDNGRLEDLGDTSVDGVTLEITHA